MVHRKTKTIMQKAWVKIVSSVLLFFVFVLFSGSLSVAAPYSDQRACEGVCGPGNCTIDPGGSNWVCLTAPKGSALPGLFGKVTPPVGVSPGVSGIGNLIGAVLRILALVSGIWALFNFIIAGYQFMQAGGDSKAVSAAWARIWQSLVGIVVVAASFLFAAIIGQLFFGDATAILKPVLVTP